jgi:RNA polymerase sigma factor (TIGR02999 family)
MLASPRLVSVIRPVSVSPTTSDPFERTQLDAVFSAAYQELHRLAGLVRGDDPAYTQSATALVNEAWLKLAGTPEVAALSPLHFRRIAARAMRQVMVEAARRRSAEKRGGNVAPITLDERHAASVETADDVILLNEALAELAQMSERQAQMIELRFFAGLEVREVAEVMGLSEATVHRDWRAARAWLAARVRDV